jgi:hypothetical protein
MTLDIVSFHVRSKVRSSPVVRRKSSAYVRIVLGEEFNGVTSPEITQLNSTYKLQLPAPNVMAPEAILQRYRKFISRIMGLRSLVE